MWTPFLARELYKYRAWIHPASHGVCQACPHPILLERFPETHPKSFWRKRTYQEMGRRRTQVTRNGLRERNEGNSRDEAEDMHAAGLEGRPHSHRHIRRGEKGFEELNPQRKDGRRHGKVFGWCIHGFENRFKISTWNPKNFKKIRQWITNSRGRVNT